MNSQQLRKLFSAISIACLIALVTTTSANAQPGGDTVEQLRAQMERMAQQLRELEQTKTESESVGAPRDADRVRSLGSQRPVQPVVFEETRHLKLYDLSDIFSFSTQYPVRVADPFSGLGSSNFFRHDSDRSSLNGGGMGGGMGGGGVFNIHPLRQDANTIDRSDIQVSIAGVIEAIVTNVEPDQWEENSGASGDSTISQLGNMLLVSATPSTHEQIASLLDLFREKWVARRTVAIHVYWIRADVASVTKLLDENLQTSTGVGVIADDRWEPFFASALSEKRLAYTSSITGHNGQTLHAVSGKHLELTVGSQPWFNRSSRFRSRENDESNTDDELATGDEFETDDEIETETIAGIHPKRKFLFTGALAELTPLTRGGNFAIIDLKTAITELLPPTAEAKPVEASVWTTDGQTMTVRQDDCSVASYRLSTTLRCPTSRVVLAGGMTGTGDRSESPLELFVFVRATTHAIQEDTSDPPSTNLSK